MCQPTAEEMTVIQSQLQLLKHIGMGDEKRNHPRQAIKGVKERGHDEISLWSCYLLS